MKNLIITADDFGVFPAINEAVFEAVAAGKVTSVAAFSNYDGEPAKGYMSAAAHTQELFSRYGDRIEIGCHLTITSGKPVTGTAMEFACDSKGNFRDWKEQHWIKEKTQLTALEQELIRQIEILQEAGIPVKHLTCHHNALCYFPDHFEVYLRVARSKNLPMRSVDIRPENKQHLFNRLLTRFLCDDITAEEREVLKKFVNNIVPWYKTNAADVRMPDYLNSAHYGPVWLVPGLVTRVITPLLAGIKRRKLRRVLGEFSTSPEKSLELMLHLGSGSFLHISRSPDLDYSGVDRKYFDSRTAEFRSIMGFDFEAMPGITREGWKKV